MNMPHYQFLKKNSFFKDMRNIYPNNILMNIPSKMLTHASTEP